MELTDKGYEIVTETLDDIINKAVSSIQQGGGGVLHEMRALAVFAVKILRNESLISRRNSNEQKEEIQ